MEVMCQCAWLYNFRYCTNYTKKRQLHHLYSSQVLSFWWAHLMLICLNALSRLSMAAHY